MSHSYPSDISREQFALVLPILLTARRRTKPRTVDLYDIFRGVLYVLKSGCQWRMLPADLPQWQTCYKYFRQWSERPNPAQPSILEEVLKKSVAAVRQSNGRKERTSFCIVDAQSVKNTDSAENKGYDAGKKVSGIKRHIAVDTQGLPHAIHVTTANVTDRAGALAMFDHHQADLGRVQKVLVDGGYTGKPFAEAVAGAARRSPRAGRQEQREAVGRDGPGMATGAGGPAGAWGGGTRLGAAQRGRRRQGTPGIRLGAGGDLAPSGAGQGVLVAGPAQHRQARGVGLLRLLRPG